ncbi:hypothetical protein EJ06DRAFT_291494 [Trichodelitschia bisporula]|uniref:Uncharacterized protein n=1 Tax=Trichodelitschia bisporula TaxID=703511 RepID=A0A6G1I6B9_9PEZI|nr:hypothetical protein EJ06DRAFT_291494 [Trichodelitschia bisporula]
MLLVGGVCFGGRVWGARDGGFLPDVSSCTRTLSLCITAPPLPFPSFPLSSDAHILWGCSFCICITKLSLLCFYLVCSLYATWLFAPYDSWCFPLLSTLSLRSSTERSISRFKPLRLRLLPVSCHTRTFTLSPTTVVTSRRV